MIKFVSYINAVYSVLFGSEIFMTAPQLETLRSHLLKLGKYHMACHQHAQALGEELFPVRPKAHYAQHFGFQAELINPRYVMCYQAESMMGKMTAIWHGSAAGPYGRTIQYVVCLKYLVALSIELDL